MKAVIRNSVSGSAGPATGAGILDLARMFDGDSTAPAILLTTDNYFVKNLAQAILDLYHHPEKRHAMSQAALNRSKLFSKERYAQEFFEALTHIERTCV